MGLRVIFMGTPDFAVGTLTQIVGHGHELVGVYSQPPRPADRGMSERKSPVHTMAEAFGAPVFTPQSLKDTKEPSGFKALKADVAVVVAYGQILPKSILNAPKFGCLNLHASLLPRWRGAAPIQRAIMAGDETTGVCVMKMEEGLDTGPVALREDIAIGRNMTAGDLHDELAIRGADLMADALDQLDKQKGLNFTDQKTTGVTYANKISKYETRIKWTRNAKDIHNHIRGMSPWPGAWCEFETGGSKERLKVLRSKHMEGEGLPGEVLDGQLTIACGSGAVRLEQVQRAGKKPMTAEEFLRGAPIGKGSVLL